MPPLETKKHLTQAQKDLLVRWVKEGAEYQPHWSLIKASALYHLFNHKLDFVFDVAGRELAYIKAHACGRENVRVLVPEMWANMKPRKIKNGAAEEDVALESEYETAVEEEGAEFEDEWDAWDWVDEDL